MSHCTEKKRLLWQILFPPNDHTEWGNTVRVCVCVAHKLLDGPWRCSIFSVQPLTHSRRKRTAKAPIGESPREVPPPPPFWTTQKPPTQPVHPHHYLQAPLLNGRREERSSEEAQLKSFAGADMILCEKRWSREQSRR